MENYFRIAINVEIENNRSSIANFSANCTDMILSGDYTSPIDADQFLDRVKQAMKLLKSFNMLTITVTLSRLERDYIGKIIGSVRFADGQRSSLGMDNSYTEWLPCKKSRIYADVVHYVGLANNECIKLLSKVAEPQ